MSDPNPYARLPLGDSIGGTPDATAQVGVPVEPPAAWISDSSDDGD